MNSGSAQEDRGDRFPQPHHSLPESFPVGRNLIRQTSSMVVELFGIAAVMSSREKSNCHKCRDHRDKDVRPRAANQ
jgi:hypothetical protein